MNEGNPLSKAEIFQQQTEASDKKSLEDLHALAELLNLKILREDKRFTTPTIVVEGEDGKEVHIGYPEGGSTHPDGGIYPAATTGKIKGVTTIGYGHGEWLYSIAI